MAISGHFDLPARAGVLEQVTYVGHDSCSFCDEHGEVVKTNGRGHPRLRTLSRSLMIMKDLG